MCLAATGLPGARFVLFQPYSRERRVRDDDNRRRRDDRSPPARHLSADTRHVKEERNDRGYADERRASVKPYAGRAVKTEGGRRHRDVKTERDVFLGDSSSTEQYGRPSTEPAAEPVSKEQPNFQLSGKLTEDANTFRGVVVQYSEPAEARRPKRRWRLYPFKGEDNLPLLHIHRQSAYLIGRDRRVADIPVDHPSCSKQHAALQYRLVSYKRDDGRPGRRVRLYLIDLGSANGTYVNAERIEARRYVELLEKDVIKFGYSSREYVLLHDKTNTAELCSDEDDEGIDDVALKEEEEAKTRDKKTKPT